MNIAKDWKKIENTIQVDKIEIKPYDDKNRLWVSLCNKRNHITEQDITKNCLVNLKDYDNVVKLVDAKWASSGGGPVGSRYKYRISVTVANIEYITRKDLPKELI